MKWFRFEIPTNADGTRVSYSPGWHGVSDKCPQKVTVVLYNDKEGYGIAQTEDTFIPKESTSITKTVFDSTLALAKDEDGIYFGDKLVHRWDAKEEPIEDKEIG